MRRGACLMPTYKHAPNASHRIRWLAHQERHDIILSKCRRRFPVSAPIKNIGADIIRFLYVIACLLDYAMSRLFRHRSINAPYAFLSSHFHYLASSKCFGSLVIRPQCQRSFSAAISRKSSRRVIACGGSFLACVIIGRSAPYSAAHKNKS